MAELFIALSLSLVQGPLGSTGCEFLSSSWATPGTNQPPGLLRGRNRSTRATSESTYFETPGHGYRLHLAELTNSQPSPMTSGSPSYHTLQAGQHQAAGSGLGRRGPATITCGLQPSSPSCQASESDIDSPLLHPCPQRPWPSPGCLHPQTGWEGRLRPRSLQLRMQTLTQYAIAWAKCLPRMRM